MWWFVLLYELINAISLSSLAYIYYTSNDRNSLLWFLKFTYLYSEAQSFLDTECQPVAWSVFFLASLFCWEALTMIIYSIWRRRFCYGLEESIRRSLSASAKRRKKQLSFWKALLMAPVNVFKSIVSVWSSFGVRGEYYQAGNLIRRVTEVAMVTIQANSSSQMISNVYINQTYGVLLTLTCVLPSVFTHIYRGRHVLERLVSVTSDLTLNFLWGTVIPFFMFLPYIRLYILSQTAVGFVAPPNVEQEVERILILSRPAFVMTIFPFVSTLLSLRAIKIMLCEIDIARTWAAVAPHTDLFAPQPTRKSTIHLVASKLEGYSWLSRWIYRLLLLYGIGILAISIAASGLLLHQQSGLYTCDHRVYPWLTSKEACSGRTIDCTQAGISGLGDEIESALDDFDPASLASLIIEQCTDLQIPSSIHRFANLRKIMIRDSVLSEWSSEAAVNQSFFKVIRAVLLTNVSITSEPSGLIRSRLPLSLEWISINTVDTSGWIDNIGSNWSTLKYFYCDSCNLTRFPDIVRGMTELLELSACYNSFPSIDDDQISQLALLENVWLDGSPLSSLPDALWRMSSSLLEIYFQNTDMASVPSWVSTNANSELQMFGYGTPLCANATEAALVKGLTCELSFF